MNEILILLIIIWILTLVYYVYYIYMLMKNVKPEYENDKFKIFGVLLIINKTYFDEIGIIYLPRVKFLAIILFILIIILPIYLYN